MNNLIELSEIEAHIVMLGWTSLEDLDILVEMELTRAIELMSEVHKKQFTDMELFEAYHRSIVNRLVKKYGQINKMLEN